MIIQDNLSRQKLSIAIPVDIERLARNYLGLKLRYMKLSDSGRILGLTSYKGVNMVLPFTGGDVFLSVPEDTIMLDESLLENDTRTRFTVAHECAHQIIARLEERQTGMSFRKVFMPGATYSWHELKTAERWSEWQANTLGAALLIPRGELAWAWHALSAPQTISLLDGRFSPLAYALVKQLAIKFAVSIGAMTVRLKKLGFVTEFSKVLPQRLSLAVGVAG